MKKGDRVQWQYTHHLNSRSSVERIKVGTIIELTGDVKNVRHVSGSRAKVLFDGNKHPSKVPIKDLQPITSPTSNSKYNG